MIRNILHEVGGIGVFGITSMLLFVSFFLGVTIWAVLMRKHHIAHMSSMPLETDENDVKGGQNND